MANPIWTQAFLDAAQAALLQALKGKTVTFADRSWTSQDIGELRELIAVIERSINTDSRSYRLAATSKGV